MRLQPLALLASLVWAGLSWGQGFLIPDDRTCPPMAMVSHRVDVVIEDQVAVTRVEQTFRNPSPRPQEATYVFPVPRGASVTEFALWVDGKKVKGELVEADKARQIYTDIVRRLNDPGLLEYLGTDLLRLRVFPVPARGTEDRVELHGPGAQGRRPRRIRLPPEARREGHPHPGGLQPQNDAEVATSHLQRLQSDARHFDSPHR